AGSVNRAFLRHRGAVLRRVRSTANPTANDVLCQSGGASCLRTADHESPCVGLVCAISSLAEAPPSGPTPAQSRQPPAALRLACTCQPLRADEWCSWRAP